MKIKTILSSLVLTSVISSAAFANAHEFLNRDTELSKKGTLDICVEYATLTDDAKKKEYKDELDLRSQLSVKDHDNVDKGIVENSMTMCGMYMAKGKPLAEQSRQIRPMTFKVVHVYDDMYFVSQSGMIVGSYKREEGVMPPALAAEKPDVMPPPVMPH